MAILAGDRARKGIEEEGFPAAVSVCSLLATDIFNGERARSGGAVAFCSAAVCSSPFVDCLVVDGLEGVRMSKGLIIPFGFFSTFMPENSGALAGERARSGVDGFGLPSLTSFKAGLEGE